MALQIPIDQVKSCWGPEERNLSSGAALSLETQNWCQSCPGNTTMVVEKLMLLILIVALAAWERNVIRYLQKSFCLLSWCRSKLWCCHLLERKGLKMLKGVGRSCFPKGQPCFKPSFNLVATYLSACSLLEHELFISTDVPKSLNKNV